MLIELLIAAISLVVIAAIYELLQLRRQSREFRHLVAAARVEETLAHVHQSLPPPEAKKLEDGFALALQNDARQSGRRG